MFFNFLNDFYLNFKFTCEMGLCRLKATGCKQKGSPRTGLTEMVYGADEPLCGLFGGDNAFC